MNAPDGDHAAIERFLDERRAAQVRFLSHLVRQASDNPPGNCAAMAECAAALIEEMGFRVERHPVPPEQCRAAGMLSATNLIVRRRFSEGPTVALNAHGDVVPPGEGWAHDPYGAGIEGKWMYGRGVAVSKSDFATYTFALLALEQVANSLAGCVELHFTFDEEAGGSIGPKWLLERGLSKPDLVIAAGFSYGIVTAHNGCLHLEVEVRGRSAHAACPETGRDALEAANGILTALYTHRREFEGRQSGIEGVGSPRLVVGLIEGGINTNVVPDRVTLRLDRRIIPEEDAAKVEATLRKVIDHAVKVHEGISVRTSRVLLAEPLQPVEGTGRLIGPIRRHAAAVLGEDIREHGVPLYTDARHYARAGVPVVLYGAGPRTLEQAHAHRADERLLIEDLHGATKVVALALRDVLER